jgi:hypothetical protein
MGLDGRTTQQTSYTTSQRIRKRVEEIIGWIKKVTTDDPLEWLAQPAPTPTG